MIKKIIFSVLFLVLFSTYSAFAEWNFSYSGEASALYGYADVSSKYKKNNKNNHAPTDAWLSFLAENEFSDDYALSLFADFMGGTDKYLKDYNHGSWGQELYAKWQTPVGIFAAGQMMNAAYEQGVSAPSFGPLKVNNSDVVDFIANPNWVRRKKNTSFKTLNSTYINTDGDAAKISYFSPEFYDTTIGFSYVPYTYSRAGLVSKRASYHDKGGAVVSLLNSHDFDFVEMKTSLAYAEFFDNDKEYSGGISFYRKGVTLGGSYRRTNSRGKKQKDFILPEFFDAYRNSEAYAVGLGYEIGPYKTAVTYFSSKTKKFDFEDKIIQFSNEYRLKKNLLLYAALAHVKFESEKGVVKTGNQGYAFVIGAGLDF